MDDITLADVFNDEAFAMTTLTAAINELPYIPHRIGELGIFNEHGIPTTTVAIEKRGEALALVSTKPRGAPGTPMVRDKRKAVTFDIPHIPVQDSMVPDEIQNVRGFGTGQLQGIAEVRDQKLQKMSDSLDLTLEYHRLGAIQGLVLDADGTVLFDLFDEFGVSQPAIVDLNLDASFVATGPGVIRPQITDIKRSIRNALGGTVVTGVLGLCGDSFFDTLTNHPEVRQTYLNQQEAAGLRENDALESFRFAGVTFENYRGFGTVAIDDDKCQFVPLGVPDLFITRFAPAPWWSAVNSIGLPRYTMATLDSTGQKRIDLESQSNPINICTRPQALFRAKIT